MWISGKNPELFPDFYLCQEWFFPKMKVFKCVSIPNTTQKLSLALTLMSSFRILFHLLTVLQFYKTLFCFQASWLQEGNNSKKLDLWCLWFCPAWSGSCCSDDSGCPMDLPTIP